MRTIIKLNITNWTMKSWLFKIKTTEFQGVRHWSKASVKQPRVGTSATHHVTAILDGAHCSAENMQSEKAVLSCAKDDLSHHYFSPILSVCVSLCIYLPPSPPPPQSLPAALHMHHTRPNTLVSDGAPSHCPSLAPWPHWSSFRSHPCCSNHSVHMLSVIALPCLESRLSSLFSRAVYLLNYLHVVFFSSPTAPPPNISIIPCYAQFWN